MVVLDSFPFQEDDDVQYLGDVRRSAQVPTRNDHQNRFNSPKASLADSGICSSNTACENLQPVQLSEHSQIKQTEYSQGYMEGVENSRGYLKCRLCHYQTKIESLLRRHVIKHSLDSDFRCPACDFRENDPSKFVNHIGTHQSGKLVRCCFCPKKMSRGKLKSHIRIHRAVELYDCSMCQFSTNYEKTIKSHMDVYHTKEYPCQQCGLIMSKHDLHWHMKFVHSMEPTELPEAVPLAVPAGRGTNSKTFKVSSKILNQSIFSRKFCTSKISRKTSVALKMQKHTKKQFNCGKCEYKTPFKKLLRAHRAKHLLDNSLVCTKCGFKEVGPGKFSSHLALHSSSDMIECCFCSFQTPIRGTMSNHVSKHKPLPMYDCSECEFAAKRPASVRLHTANVHGKRAQCQSCGVEMSRFALAGHRKECHARDDGAGTGKNPETENESNAEPDAVIDNVANENNVSCEFCKKLYAKSYIRKHAKKCQLENGFDAESKIGNESKSVAYELQPFGGNMTNEVVAAVLAPNTISDHPASCESYNVLKSIPPSRSNKPRKPLLHCNSCIFKTKKKHLLKKHVVKHLIDFRLTCPECGHKEMSSSRFANHLTEHGKDPETFQCCFCSLSTPSSKRSYSAHLDKHRPVNIFDCPKCEYSSNRADNVRNHCKNNHSKNRKCHHCGELMSKARLITHLLEYHGEVKSGRADETSCIDPPSINTDVNLDGVEDADDQESADISHMVQVELNPPDDEMSLVETDRDFLKCTKCPFQTKIQSLMDRHVAKHLIDVPFVCPLCGFEHISSRKFANHWDKHECNAKKKVYQCCFCDAEIKKKNCLKAFLPQHIESHRRVALQDCSECEFSSHSRYELEKHHRNQHLKKCECLLCGAVMTIFEHSFHTGCSSVRAEGVNDSAETDRVENQGVDFSTLRRHSSEVQDSLIAALEDPASLCDAGPSALAHETMYCSSCDYNTQFKSLLERHVLKHLIDVPFPCSDCSFSCFDERSFADHRFTHNRSYKCQFCSYRAGNVTGVSRHYSSHKALAINDCSKCEFTSTYKYRLVEHMRGRHVAVPRCSYCGKKMLKYELNSHERECSKSLRRRNSSRTVLIEKDVSGALDDTSPQEGLLGYAAGCDNAEMKERLLHELNLAPINLSSNFESCLLTDGNKMQGSLSHSSEVQSGLVPAAADGEVRGMPYESDAITDFSGQDPWREDPVFVSSLPKIANVTDHVLRASQESYATAVQSCGNPQSVNSTTDTSPRDNDLPAVIQDGNPCVLRSFQDVNGRTGTSPRANKVGVEIQKSNSAAIVPGQDLELNPSSSSAATSSHSNYVTPVIKESNAVAVMDCHE